MSIFVTYHGPVSRLDNTTRVEAILSAPGEHPRLGALDVCPFIPVQGVTMQDCVECAQEFGEKLAEELGIPGQLTWDDGTQFTL